jgi:hypothetical protein
VSVDILLVSSLFSVKILFILNGSFKKCKLFVLIHKDRKFNLEPELRYTGNHVRTFALGYAPKVSFSPCLP